VLHISSSFDAIDWIVKYWDLEALALMRDVSIEVQAVDLADTRFHLLEGKYNALEIFARNAHEGEMLQN
jgi:hypothetical protein